MNILNKLTIKHLKLNKKRTIVTIIGIILSTALMVGIGLLMSTVRENMIDLVKSSNGSHEISITDLNKSQYDQLTKNEAIKNIEITSITGYSLIDLSYSEYDPYASIVEASKSFLERFKLIEGRTPENDHEILLNNNPLYPVTEYKVGDKITLEVGSLEIVDSEDELEAPKINIINSVSKEYTIVGIIETDIYLEYDEVGPFYTVIDTPSDNLTAYLYFKSTKNINDKGNAIKDSLSLKNEQVIYNTELISLYGESKYDNLNNSIRTSLIVILSILSIGCIVVIYNSFAISVMERKKQFGLLSSIGTTKNQIRKTIFFEALVVGTIGIIVGIISAYVGIGIVLTIINELLPDIFGNGSILKLVTYPVFIFIPVIFMIITILVSAFLPARSASRITPIEAIRLNDDIKIKGKKVKTPKIIRKIFGMEGEIALKNIKRNKKKYRITILSLFISIVLFISFSAYMDYIFSGVKSVAIVPTFDADIELSFPANEETINDAKYTSFYNEIEKNKEVTAYFNYNRYQLTTTVDLSNKAYYEDKFYDLEENRIKELKNNNAVVTLMEVDNDFYQDLLKSIGESEIKPIVYNRYKKTISTTNSRKTYETKKYKSSFNEIIPLCETIYDNDTTTYGCEYEISDYYFTEAEFFGNDAFALDNSVVVIIPANYFGDLKNFNDGVNFSIFVNLDDDEQFEKALENIAKKYNIDYSYINISQEYRMIHNAIFCVKLLVYGFISLVTLIGVTSVFNTINTSIHLRRKEFAMLRSMGLSNHGFNKILLFESLFFGLKSLLYALPVSMGVIYLLYLSFKGMIDMDAMLIPTNSIILAIVAVFIIIIISTLYATRKIRHENILDAIREENI